MQLEKPQKRGSLPGGHSDPDSEELKEEEEVFKLSNHRTQATKVRTSPPAFFQLDDDQIAKMQELKQQRRRNNANRRSNSKQMKTNIPKPKQMSKSENFKVE